MNLAGPLRTYQRKPPQRKKKKKRFFARAFQSCIGTLATSVF
jgi:hypothetical protein